MNNKNILALKNEMMEAKQKYNDAIVGDATIEDVMRLHEHYERLKDELRNNGVLIGYTSHEFDFI